MSREAMIVDLIRKQARELKMPSVTRNIEALVREAKKEGLPHEELVHDLLAAEITSRSESAVKQRTHDARFPELKTIDTFDFDAAEGIEASRVAELARGTWIANAHNLVLAGPIGTGKTHLAIALGIEAARMKKRVAFHRAADLVRMLVEARDARELGILKRRLDRVDVLIIDELGFVPFDRHGGELLFHTIADRYEKRSVVVTTNLAFSEWPKVFGDDEKLTTALLDRLAHHATILTTRGKSFRMRRRTQEETVSPVGAPEAPDPTIPVSTARNRRTR